MISFRKIDKRDLLRNEVFLIAFTLMIVLYFKEKGLSVESALSFINWPVLQMIPVVGWQIAVYRLVLLGPTTLNVICTVIYSVFTVFIVAAAFRMKCDGGYYEEAAKFADDYAELKEAEKRRICDKYRDEKAKVSPCRE